MPSDGKNIQANLASYLGLLNQTPPIVSCQFEVWYSKWPRTMWFAQDITVPGIKNNTGTIFYNALSVNVVTSIVYSTYEVSMTILDDELGYNYACWRDLVILHALEGFKGRPIVETSKALLNGDGVYQGAGYLIVKLVNSEKSHSQHIWRIHNFKPTDIGTVRMGHENSSFVTFEVTGTFTHITFVQDPEDEDSLSGAAYQPPKNEIVAAAPAAAGGGVQPPMGPTGGGGVI